MSGSPSLELAVTNPMELRPLEANWRALAVGQGNAFLTPDWFYAWLAHLGAGSRPFIPVLRGPGGDLRGLLPMAFRRSGYMRSCQLAGADLGDHFGPVCTPQNEQAVAAAAGRALAGSEFPWSTIRLHNTTAGAAWPEALRRGTQRRLGSWAGPPAVLPRIELSRHESWDAYLATRSSNLRQQVRRFWRRLSKDHGARLRRTETVEELETDIATFFELHRRRWSQKGDSSLSSDGAQAFHKAFSRAALTHGWLRLWTLELGGEPAASLYGWRIGERYAFYNSGFDPAWKASRPGLVLLSKVIESAFEEGAGEFDLLQGDDAYKMRFAESSREVNDIVMARSIPHPASTVVVAERTARGVLRRLRSRSA